MRRISYQSLFSRPTLIFSSHKSADVKFKRRNIGSCSGCGSGRGGCGSQKPVESSTGPTSTKTVGGGQKSSTGAPFRHPLAWKDPQFYDKKALDQVRIQIIMIRVHLNRK